MTFASVLPSLGFKGRMNFDTKELAQSFCVLKDFAHCLEGLDVSVLRFNGFVFSEGPNFLHFKLYK